MYLKQTIPKTLTLHDVFIYFSVNFIQTCNVHRIWLQNNAMALLFQALIISSKSAGRTACNNHDTDPVFIATVKQKLYRQCRQKSIFICSIWTATHHKSACIMEVESLKHFTVSWSLLLILLILIEHLGIKKDTFLKVRGSWCSATIIAHKRQKENLTPPEI